VVVVVMLRVDVERAVARLNFVGMRHCIFPSLRKIPTREGIQNRGFCCGQNAHVV
jgi:hypothetical protein